MSLPWIKLHARIRRHRKSDVLADLLGRKRAWTHVVELWLWASEECPDGDLSGLPAKVIARNAGWTGNADRFLDALREAGFLDGDELHGWDEHQEAHVEAAEARVSSLADSNEPEDKLARQRAQAAERQARYRKAQAERDATASESVTRNASERDASVTSVTERDASRSASVTERDENALQRARTKKENKIKKETEREHTSTRERDADESRDDSPAKPDPTDIAVTEVLEHWRTCVERPGWAIEGRGAEKRRSRIRERLRDGLTVAQLKRAADGAALDDWLMGRDPKVTKAGGWRDVETVYRDRPKVEELIALADSPPVSRRTRPAPYDPKTTVYEANDPDLMAEFAAAAEGVTF